MGENSKERCGTGYVRYGKRQQNTMGIRIKDIQIAEWLSAIIMVVQIPILYLKQHSNNSHLSDIQMAFKYQTIQKADSLPPFRYHTGLLFRSPLYWS